MANPKERVIVGIHAVEEALRCHGREISKIWVRSDSANNDLKNILNLAQKFKIPVEKKNRQQLEQLAQVHQNVAAFTSKTLSLDWQGLVSASKALVLFLDGIEDPHNLGAILRTAWLMGANGVVIPQSRAVGLTGTVAKVACGGAEHVPLETTSHIEGTLEQLKKIGFWVYGLSHEAEHSLWQIEFAPKCVLVIGAEDKGLKAVTQKQCDTLLAIPQNEASASYNASVAAALAMGEWKRTQYAK